jgi:hypothetical protein
VGVNTLDSRRHLDLGAFASLDFPAICEGEELAPVQLKSHKIEQTAARTPVLGEGRLQIDRWLNVVM